MYLQKGIVSSISQKFSYFIYLHFDALYALVIKFNNRAESNLNELIMYL